MRRLNNSRISRALGGALLTTVLAVAPGAQAQPGTTPGKGRLLVASEGLLDPNFERTVVLLLEHGLSGSLGLVLNRPSRLPVSRLLPDLEGVETFEQPFFIGGPVEIHQMSMLFSTGEEHAGHLNVLGKVYAGWDEGLFERMVHEPREQDRFRLYAGHAGWAPGQLEAEIAAHGWHVFPGSESTIFAAESGGSEELWREFIRRTRTRIAALPAPDPE
ncbi:MAG: YqgE/AlgH family protein [bacterium]|nr:YqgE/AlgH family protein [bacterium]